MVDANEVGGRVDDASGEVTTGVDEFDLTTIRSLPSSSSSSVESSTVTADDDGAPTVELVANGGEGEDDDGVATMVGAAASVPDDVDAAIVGDFIDEATAAAPGDGAATAGADAAG